MLIYDPALDPSHYIFRLLKIIHNAIDTEIEIDKYRIVDFYLLFPVALAKFRFPGGAPTEIRRTLKALENRYTGILSPQLHFQKNGMLQIAAISHLSSLGILDNDRLKSRMLKRTKKSLPEEINQKLTKTINNKSEIETFILSVVLQLPLLGDGGLKARSGLLEHKYDVI